MSHETLLPPNSTEFERAIEQATARVADIPVDPLRQLRQPYKVSTSLLPWLAWGLSVDFWRSSWTEEQRRNFAARSLPWHQRKGSRAAIREAISFTGNSARDFVTPPSKTFLMREYTDEERAKFLKLFAQLRVYPWVRRSTGRHFARFLSSAGDGMAASAYAGPISALGPTGSRFTRTAAVWDAGTETQITHREIKLEKVADIGAVEYDEVVIPARKTRSIHLGAIRNNPAYLVDDQSVRRRMVRISRDADYEYRIRRETYTTVWPDAGLIHVAPEKVAEAHPAQNGSRFPGRKAGQRPLGGFLPPSVAWRHVFERWHLHDPTRVPEARVRSVHLGNTRLGLPPYHAEVRVRITGKRHKKCTCRFVGGHMLTTSKDAIKEVRDATRAAKSLRDKVLLDTKNWRLPQPGDRLPIGSVKIGQFIEV